VQPNAQYEAPLEAEAQPPESAVRRVPLADARPGGARGIRFGFTVGRRQARRAVLRVMVKRVLRESARNGAASLCQLARGRGIDVVLRLRSPLPDPSKMGLSQLKRSLREEADSLIEQLGRHLAAGGKAARRGGLR
jgi:RNase P protein component